MNFSHPTLYLDQLKAERDVVERDADMRMLVAEAKRTGPQSTHPIRRWVGHAFVRFGERLERIDGKPGTNRQQAVSTAISLAR